MFFRHQKAPRGFTLVELLVVIAVISVLAGFILPALAAAKQKSLQATCMSNLKQVGLAIHLYTDDHEDFLPGPIFAGARASYDETSSTELIWHLATYLGLPPLPKTTVIAKVFVCPGYQRSAPNIVSMEGRKCYLLNDDLDPNPLNRVPPFGYPAAGGAAATPALKITQLDGYLPPSSIFAITDVDKINVPNPTVSWWSDLPYKPVHGNVRNELYFDWHVAARKVDW